MPILNSFHFLELLDPPLRNASFTWSNLQESPVCKRLDRFLYSNEWGLLFPQGLQEALIRRTSDHWPIVLDTNPFMWGPTPFRFENVNILISRRSLEIGGMVFKETDGKATSSWGDYNMLKPNWRSGISFLLQSLMKRKKVSSMI